MPRSILLLSTIATALTLNHAVAREVDQATVERLSRHWLDQQALRRTDARTIRDVSRIAEAPAGVTAYLVRLRPRGYLVLLGDTRLPPVLAFGLHGDGNLSPGPGNAFGALLRRDLQRLQRGLAIAAGTRDADSPAEAAAIATFFAANQGRWAALQGEAAADAAATATLATGVVGPLLATTWNQNRHYNFLMPADPYGSGPGSYYDDKVPTGCVQTAWAQVLKYYEWPPHGRGTRQYQDTWGALRGTHTADFADPYDWANMQPAYAYTSEYGAEQVAAVSELLYELAVLNEADFESGGSSTASHAANIDQYLLYQSSGYVDTGVADGLRAEVTAGRPAVGYIPNHAVVVDGYRDDLGGNYFHVNYGWGGSNDGWYLLGAIPGGGLDAFHASRPSYDPLIESAAYAPGTSRIDLTWLSPAKVSPPIERFRVSVAQDQYYSQWSDEGVDLTRWTTGPVTGWEHKAGVWQAAASDGRTTLYSDLWPAWLVLRDIVVPQTGATLALDYKLLLRSGGRLAVAVSEDGLYWTDLYQERGSDSYVVPAWQSRSIDLSAYAGKPISLRIGQEPVVSTTWSYWYGGGIWLDRLTLGNTSLRTWSVVDDYVDAASRAYAIAGSGPAVPQVRVEAMVEGAWTGSAVGTVSGTASTAPAAPSNLAASAASGPRVDLTWQDNSDDETFFRLERRTGSSGAWTVVAKLKANVTAYSDTGVSPRTTYFYRLLAGNGSGKSAYAPKVKVTTLRR